MEEIGIGLVNAAVVNTAWFHLGRVRSEAAVAALAGVNPIPASSEKPRGTDSAAEVIANSTTH
ncbi:hypothetical protein GCM10009720_06670 [Yaniella flava]|uniref:Transposase IS116/IS110/IS902 C-terminal domain-containing protein n=1 Tax=Yaniella flava TaxID=287930 RepID=A0ABP5FLM0_9MICC